MSTHASSEYWSRTKPRHTNPHSSSLIGDDCFGHDAEDFDEDVSVLGADDNSDERSFDVMCAYPRPLKLIGHVPKIWPKFRKLGMLDDPSHDRVTSSNSLAMRLAHQLVWAPVLFLRCLRRILTLLR